MSLYEDVYNEARLSLSDDDADFLAETLSTMTQDEVSRIFKAVDECEPSEAEQGLIPIPSEYAEQ